MKVTLNWLRQVVELDESAGERAAQFTRSGVGGAGVHFGAV